MMHPELPDGTLAGRRSGETYHDIFLTDAEYEVVILAAVKRGLTQGSLRGADPQGADRYRGEP